MASKEVHISGRTESRTVTGWSSPPSPTRLRTRNFSSNMGRTTGSGTTASSPPRSRPKQRPSYDICYTPEQRRTAPRDGRIHWAGKHWRGGHQQSPWHTDRPRLPALEPRPPLDGHPEDPCQHRDRACRPLAGPAPSPQPPSANPTGFTPPPHGSPYRPSPTVGDHPEAPDPGKTRPPSS